MCVSCSPPIPSFVLQVSVIPNNMEKFLSFTWNRFRFIDSCQFLNASLDKLVNATPREAFLHTSELPHHELLLRKGTYPYEYMDSFGRFDETQLPDQASLTFTVSMPFRCPLVCIPMSMLFLVIILPHTKLIC